MSDAKPLPASRTEPAAPALEQKDRWPLIQESQQWPVLARYESHGHPLDIRQVALKVSPNARQAYINLTVGAELPLNSVVIQELSGGPHEPPKALLAMSKTPDGWQFHHLTPDGKAAGSTRLCGRCHAEARSDSLFGMPAAPQPLPR